MDRTGVGTVGLWLWALILVVNGQNYVNVASGKTYSQSSIYRTQGSNSNAANGNTDGEFTASNCIHTGETRDQHPWYQVDLGKKFPVYNIDIWARTGLVDRVYPLIITVDGQTCVEKTDIPSDRHTTVTCSDIMPGQKVRITRQSRSWEDTAQRTLNLCEMQIFVCADGWYGKQCSSRCSFCQNDVCDRQSGQCSECVDRYYKSNNGTCVACSSHCLNQPCDKSTGVCTGCISGWYGDLCSTRCSDGCLNNQCQQQSGNCSPCKDGWYGDNCALSCAKGCLNNQCQHQSGKCSSCKDGWHGDQCTMSCATGCLNNQCQQQSGKCSPCKIGWYGDNCSLSCATGCRNGCDQQSGNCSSCKDGRYGDTCSASCPKGCLNICDQLSGNCSSCKTGYLGNKCTDCQDGYYSNNNMCSQCSSNCRSRMCDKSTGTCHGCIDSRFGDRCSTICQTVNCRRCDQKTGTECTQCTLKSFLLPPACTECEAGRYGQNCTQPCGHCLDSHLYGDCNPVTGICPYKCQKGWKMPLCKQEGSDENDKETVNTYAVVGSVIAGAVIIGGCIIILGIILKRRSEKTRCHESTFNDLNTASTPSRRMFQGEKETADSKAVQEQEQDYEIAEDTAGTSSVHLHPQPSTSSDIQQYQSQADSANPYDELTVQYTNTGNAHLYDRWHGQSSTQQAANTTRAADNGQQKKGLKKKTPKLSK